MDSAGLATTKIIKQPLKTHLHPQSFCTGHPIRQYSFFGRQLRERGCGEATKLAVNIQKLRKVHCFDTIVSEQFPRFYEHVRT